MDSLPPINKVFALISQEENQRRISTQLSDGNDLNGGAAFAISFDSVNVQNGSGFSISSLRLKNVKRMKMPYCTHCNIHGHFIDNSFKIYGYPPGYKPRLKDNFENSSGSNSVNQLSAPSNLQNEDKQPAIGNFVQILNPNQYQELMSMLSTHLTSSATVNNQNNDIISYAAGICHSISVNPIFSSKEFWIVDSGATKHMCSIADAFENMRIIDGSNVPLPNHKQISVKLDSDVKLGPKLILRDVLFLPQFNFNILLVSALTAGSQLALNFFHDGFIIQEAKTKKMIGNGEYLQDLYVLDTRTLNSISNACYKIE